MQALLTKQGPNRPLQLAGVPLCSTPSCLPRSLSTSHIPWREWSACACFILLHNLSAMPLCACTCKLNLSSNKLDPESLDTMRSTQARGSPEQE
eukprot:803326-Pelagomonas_calceolata.AAC.4